MRRQESLPRLVRNRRCLSRGEHGFNRRKLGLRNLLRRQLQRKRHQNHPQSSRKIRSPSNDSSRLPRQPHRSIQQTPEHSTNQKISQRSLQRRRIWQTSGSSENRRTLNQRPLFLTRNQTRNPHPNQPYFAIFAQISKQQLVSVFLQVTQTVG